MLNPAWIYRTADAFWELVGEQPAAYPCDLEAAVLFAVPVATVHLPRLRARTVDDWLLRHGSVALIDERDARLHACLVASRGKGLIFLDGADTHDQRRFSLAHELAHFMVDYLLPRNEALTALGPQILGVLDGQRTPTRAEQINAVLARVPLGVFLNLFSYDDPSVMDQEHAADKLAVELLAPAEQAVPLARDVVCRHAGYRERLDWLANAVTAAFGLPPRVARGYAQRLIHYIGADDTLPEWLQVSNFSTSRGTDG